MAVLLLLCLCHGNGRKVLIHTGGKRKIGSIWGGDHWRTALCLRGRDNTAPEGMDA